MMGTFRAECDGPDLHAASLVATKAEAPSAEAASVKQGGFGAGSPAQVLSMRAAHGAGNCALLQTVGLRTAESSTRLHPGAQRALGANDEEQASQCVFLSQGRSRQCADQTPTRALISPWRHATRNQRTMAAGLERLPVPRVSRAEVVSRRRISEAREGTQMYRTLDSIEAGRRVTPEEAHLVARLEQLLAIRKRSVRAARLRRAQDMAAVQENRMLIRDCINKLRMAREGVAAPFLGLGQREGWRGG